MMLAPFRPVVVADYVEDALDRAFWLIGPSAGAVATLTALNANLDVDHQIKSEVAFEDGQARKRLAHPLTIKLWRVSHGYRRYRTFAEPAQ